MGAPCGETMHGMVPDKLGDNEQEQPIHSHVADGKGLPCNLLEIYRSNGRVLDTLS
jgi:hypothetical protein